MKIDSPVLEGLLCIDKKAGFTSFETIRDIKKRLGLKKVGHTGTLDKFASGLLLLLSGGCTRLVPLFHNLDKEYVAKICLGTETDTLDPEGAVVMNAKVPGLADIESVLDRFTGDVLQSPPLYSAIHIKGERAYKLARRGECIDVPARRIRIDGITILAFDPPYLTVNVRCSSGTYIRSLARDMGRAAGSCGYLTALERVRIGNFLLRNETGAGNCDNFGKMMEPYEFFANLDGCGIRTVKAEYENIVRHGGVLRDEYFTSETDAETVYGLFDADRSFLGAVRKEHSLFRYLAVMNRGDS